MEKNLFIVIVVVAAFAAGCTKPGVRVDLRSFPNPVMVGPVFKIGDMGPKGSLNEYSRFKGKITAALSGAGGNRVEGNYVVHETYRSEEWRDDIAHEMSKATSGRRDLVVVVDDMEAGNWSHWSIVALMKDWISVEGRVVDPASLRKGRK